ncbi:MAG: YdiU family protein [Candidatus Velthaea sp.]|jgi:uncharacterized protein YdiU (UPF0061 family)
METIATPGSLEALRFDNRYAQLGERFSEERAPEGLPDPVLAAFAPDVAALIGLDPAQAERAEFLALASGNALLHGMQPVSTVYAGHQFGVFVPQLGDGRAILLGEVVAPDGSGYEIALKGSGRTAFSRFGDGRAVVRSTIREYLCSEAMHALGIPTTRALAMTASTEPVVREGVESAALLIRVAPSFVRFGTFEYFAHRNETDALRTLADYTIDRYFPAAAEAPDRYAQFFAQVVARTIDLAAAWQAAGFMHGVMNTDNCSILGLTLDYGPYGFMEAFDSAHICNHSDEGGRYSFAMQPAVWRWNCLAFARTLVPLTPPEGLQAVIATFAERYGEAYVARMREKLGLAGTSEHDPQLVGELLDVLDAAGADYPGVFRALGEGDEETLGRLFAPAQTAWDAWHARYRERIAADPRSPGRRRAAMHAVNPLYVLRNHLAQRAIEDAQAGDFAELGRLHEILTHPFDERPGHDVYAQPRPDDVPPVGVSCSS